MLTDGKQIAAARQLLGWSQIDLAKRSGTSKPSITKIEKDLYSVKDDIRQGVLQAFEAEKIEFIEGGTRVNQKIVTIIEGDDCYLKLLDDAYLALINTQDELLKSGVNEERSGDLVNEKVRSMRNAGIKSRSLIEEGNNFILGPLEEYRWMKSEIYTDSDVKLIYADKVAYLMSWFNTYRVIIIQDKKIAEENTRLFNYIWSISTKPSNSSHRTKERREAMLPAST